MSDQDNLLQLQDLCKRFNAPDPASDGPTVLANVNLEMRAGKAIAVIGPSGSGKSTLLNMIGALDTPTSGNVTFDGRNLASLDEAELARFRNREIGFVFQEHFLLPQCSVLENVLLPTLVPGNPMPHAEAEERARRLLARVDLNDRLSHRPPQLSGGERQRTAVVRALINSPRLILADEPTGSLDQAAADNLGVLLSELNREEHVALVVVTHSSRLAERMQNVYELRSGTLEISG